MSELANELRAIGRAINHEEYVDAGVVPLTLAHAAARIGRLEAALRLAEEVLSRAPFSTEIWPNGMHPQQGITIIRAALAEEPKQ